MASIRHLLLLTDSKTVNRELLKSLGLNLFSECLKGLFYVFLFLTVDRLKEVYLRRVSIELKLDFHFIFVEI